uniref:NADH-ubiquinone oxidoreductase chain 3 n=1 Tax=Pelagomacellicephala iliffei TaxID=1960706 RepID=A0A8E7MLP9_9ANNE|nr:NADH dehydrogenase subunit 3 [Pelagomacellicephala iliffei]
MLLSSLSLSISLLIPSLLLTLSLMISFRSSSDQEKSSPYECGFNPKSTARIPFSLRFFLLAVIFLVFDIEIVILMPCPLLLWATPPHKFLVTLFLFLIILLLGLIHEWHEGSLNWTP